MSQGSLILVGGGGHALVVAEAASIAGWDLAGYLDDSADAPLRSGEPSARWLGPLRDAEHFHNRRWILALGDLRTRRVVLDELAGWSGSAARVVHPRAYIAPSALIADGVFVAPGAIVHSRARVDAHAILNSGAIIEHGCHVGANAHIAPGAALGGDASVGDHTLLGIGARLLPGVRVGECCVVGTGAVVRADVPDGTTVVGVPASPIRGV